MINSSSFNNKIEDLKKSFDRKPFKYVVIDNFLDSNIAESILAEFPDVTSDWVDAQGLHTKNKWTQPIVEENIAAKFYEKMNSADFLKSISYITNIENLVADKSLQGAGLHQTTDKGFLNVHIDFNRHHKDHSLDRRLNLIVYFNKDWKESDGGFLELWDMEENKRIENINPIFNRCVIFETNQVSYHGQPVPVNCGDGRSRKSLSVYYYTKGRDDIEHTATHNTIYVNTQSIKGYRKILTNGVRHAVRKLRKKVSEIKKSRRA